MVLVHLQPVVIVIVCHAIATYGGVGGVLEHGLCFDSHIYWPEHGIEGGLVAAIVRLDWCPGQNQMEF